MDLPYFQFDMSKVEIRLYPLTLTEMYTSAKDQHAQNEHCVDILTHIKICCLLFRHRPVNYSSLIIYMISIVPLAFLSNSML